MNLTLTAPPPAEPVTLEELKLFLRIDGSAEDDLLLELIPAARELAEQFTGRAFLIQGWRLTLDRLSRDRAKEEWWDGVREGAIGSLLGAYAPIPLPRPPLASVQSVAAYGLDDAPSVLPASAYRVDTAGHRLILDAGAGLPPLRPYGAVEIAYTAGYGATAASVPAPIRLAVKQGAAMLYEQRGCADLPGAAKALLQPYRVVRL